MLFKKLLAALFAVISITAAAPSAPAFAGERILNMDVIGTVGVDGSLTVTENLKVLAENSETKRGIIRVFPTDYTGTDSKRYRTEFSLLSAEIDGKLAQTEVTRSGGNVEIRIMDPSVTLPRAVYSISLRYRVKGWIASRESFDELYWNVTGHDWTLPIDHASFKLALPDGAAVSHGAAYTGRAGERGRNCRAAPGGGIETTRALMPKEGLTVVYAWNKGVVTPSATATMPPFSEFLNYVFIAGIVLLIILYYLLVWYFVGKDPDPKRIIPLYKPPEGLTPGFARYLKDMGFSDDCMAADIMQLAVLGFIRIPNYASTRILMITPTDKAGDARETSSLPEPLAALLSHMPESRGKNGISVTAINSPIFRSARKALRDIYDKRAWEYFRKNIRFTVIGAIIYPLACLPLYPGTDPVFFKLFIAIFFAVFGMVWPYALFDSVLLGIRNENGVATGKIKMLCGIALICAIAFIAPAAMMGAMGFSIPCGGLAVVAAALFFSRIMPVYTDKGARAMEEIKGLEMYMGTAERHRLTMLFKPDETPQLFESLLPYAHALGCAETWADSFAETLRHSS
jgi:hypothetical protein